MIKNRNLCFLLFLCFLIVVSCTFYSYKEGNASYSEYLKKKNERTIQYVNSTKPQNNNVVVTPAPSQNKKRTSKYKNKK